MATLSPNPQCMRTLIPLWVDDLIGHKAEQGLLRWIALSYYRLARAELVSSCLNCIKYKGFVRLFTSLQSGIFDNPFLLLIMPRPYAHSYWLTQLLPVHNRHVRLRQTTIYLSLSSALSVYAHKPVRLE